jgi:hypothetical protein
MSVRPGLGLLLLLAVTVAQLGTAIATHHANLLQHTHSLLNAHVQSLSGLQVNTLQPWQWVTVTNICSIMDTSSVDTVSVQLIYFFPLG